MRMLLKPSCVSTQNRVTRPRQSRVGSDREWSHQGSASSRPAACHDGAAAGDAINLRNPIAAEGDVLLAGTAASYVMYTCTAAGTGPSSTTPLVRGISLTL